MFGSAARVGRSDILPALERAPRRERVHERCATAGAARRHPARVRCAGRDELSSGRFLDLPRARGRDQKSRSADRRQTAARNQVSSRAAGGFELERRARHHRARRDRRLPAPVPAAHGDQETAAPSASGDGVTATATSIPSKPRSTRCRRRAARSACCREFSQRASSSPIGETSGLPAAGSAAGSSGWARAKNSPTRRR